MAANKLPPKRRRFCEEYIIDCNGTQAAIRAGYSEKTAHVQGSRLLRDAKVQEAIKALQEAASKRVEVTVDFVLGGLKRESELTGEGSSPSARVRALELLGKHLVLFTEKLALTDPSGNREYGLSDHDAAAALNKLYARMGTASRGAIVNGTGHTNGHLLGGPGPDSNGRGDESGPLAGDGLTFEP